MKAAASRILRFGLAGVVGFVVDAGALAVVIGIMGPFWGRALSFFCAVIATWLINRSVTFADRHSGLPLWREFAHYLVAMLGGGVVNYAVYALVIWLAGQAGYWPTLAVAAGSLAGMGINLALARFAVFRHAVDGD